MSKFNWNYPTTMWVGENRIKDIGLACKTLNIKKPLLVTDSGLANSEIVKKTLEKLPDNAVLIIDGLVFECIGSIINSLDRFVVIALIHHPLYLEFSGNKSQFFLKNAKKLYKKTRKIIVTSNDTKQLIFEKFKIKFPNTPKQGIFFFSLSLAKYLARLLSTIVYKIIEFSFLFASSKIFKI